MTDEQEIDEVNECDESFDLCKCGCGNGLTAFSEVKDNDGYIFGHENKEKNK